MVAERIELPFAGFGLRPAIVAADGVTVSYQELATKIDMYRARLRDRGVRPGSAVLLVGDYSPESCIWLFALWQEGCIVVPVVPGSGLAEDTYADVADVSWIVVARDDVLRSAAGQSAHSLYAELAQANAPGLVIFSSGTTGQPKGALHDVRRLMSKFSSSGKALRTLGFLLFDHISGIDTVLYTLLSGGVLVCTPSRNPAVVCRTLETRKVEVLPTAPSFLNMLIMSGEVENYDLSHLKIITYGGEMMAQPVLERVATAFPNAKLVQKYGASEFGALRSRSEGNNSRWITFDKRELDWRVRDGLLEIRSGTSMLGYLNAPSPFTEDGWYQTGDRVEIKGDKLRILGRDSDLISVGGQKVYPTEVEDALKTIPWVLDAVVYGQPHPMLGACVHARIQTKKPTAEQADLRRSLRKNLAARLETYKIPQRFEFTDAGLLTDRFKADRSATERKA